MRVARLATRRRYLARKRHHLALVLSFGATGCSTRGAIQGNGPSQGVPSSATGAPTASTSPTRSARPPHPIRVADIPAPVDALAATSTALYAVSKDRGLVFAVPLNPPNAGAAKILSSSEHEPFAIVVRGNEPIWATANGVFAADEKGGRRALMNGVQVRAVTTGPNAVYVAVDDAIWRIDGSHSSVPAKVTTNAYVDELVVVGRSLVWRDGRQLWRFDLDDGKRTKLSPDNQRKPHDLSTDGKVVFWHEGEAELLPGRNPDAFLVDPSKSWGPRELPGGFGAWESADDYLVSNGYIYGAAKCKSVAQTEWQQFNSNDPQTSQGGAPVSENERSWYWIEMICADGGCGEGSRIFSVDKSACRH